MKKLFCLLPLLVVLFATTLNAQKKSVIYVKNAANKYTGDYFIINGTIYEHGVKQAVLLKLETDYHTDNFANVIINPEICKAFIWVTDTYGASYWQDFRGNSRASAKRQATEYFEGSSLSYKFVETICN